MIPFLFKKALWVSALGLFLLGYAVLVEPAQLKIRHVEFTSDKYDGPDIRIALITDIHINSLSVPPHRILKIVDAVNKQNPDLVLIPGDFVAGHDKAERRTPEFNRRVALGLSYFQGLSATSFATIGNHDAWWNAASVTAHLQEADVTVLENNAKLISGLCIVGLADFMTSTPKKSAYDSCPPGVPPLVFTHSPDAWQAFRSDSVLVLAGHTHGGQVNLPIIGRRVNAISLGPEHSYGFSKIAGVDMFVSAGVGTSMLPIRFRAPPEVVILTLRSSQPVSVLPPK